MTSFGDFNNTFLRHLRSYLIKIVPERVSSYVDRVIMPTVLKWILIAKFDIDEKESNFYFENGCRHKAEKMMNEFEMKIKKKRRKRRKGKK